MKALWKVLVMKPMIFANLHHQSSNHPSVITGCPLESFVSDRKLGRRLLKQPWLVRPGDESFQAQQVRVLSQVGLNSKECHLWLWLCFFGDNFEAYLSGLDSMNIVDKINIYIYMYLYIFMIYIYILLYIYDIYMIYIYICIIYMYYIYICICIIYICIIYIYTYNIYIYLYSFISYIYMHICN